MAAAALSPSRVAARPMFSPPNTTPSPPTYFFVSPVLSGRRSGNVLAAGHASGRPVQNRTRFVALDGMLWLPTFAPNSAKLMAVEASIADLGLDACAHTIVSNAFVCSVSGGERKRVSIEHKLLVNPSPLVLDESTSDSTTASRLISTLSALSSKGCTV
ncbi:hypothetical protein QYE76_021259 [Lolium multiflorum]|uniref:ABC transporter domain-containing protein n=1 Tax=Lolium multiflorum TaxID=4521 RepID=A0AAD8R7D8_LOLMU|nr:hypothetical protein QYE76_021259 [Lolium multiflorum]